MWRSNKSIVQSVRSMAWSFKKIEGEWLHGAVISHTPEEIVTSFELVERILGPEWLQSYKPAGVFGAVHTLGVVSLGQCLQVINQTDNAELLVNRLKKNDIAANSELTAMHVLATGCGRLEDLRFEIVDPHAVPKGVKASDFRVQIGDNCWIQVEVTRPDMSEVAHSIIKVASEIGNVALSIERQFALEIFLRREPTTDEITLICQRIPLLCDFDGERVEDLPGLALLLLNKCPVGQAVISDHGEGHHCCFNFQYVNIPSCIPRPST